MVKYVWKPADNLTIIINAKDSRLKPDQPLDLEIKNVIIQQTKYMGSLKTEDNYSSGDFTEENLVVIRDLISPIYDGATDWTELPTVDEGRNRW